MIDKLLLIVKSFDGIAGKRKYTMSPEAVRQRQENAARRKKVQEVAEKQPTARRKDLFDAQDALVEKQPKQMQNRTYGKALEHAGDIFRELTVHDEIEPFSRGYIAEKVRRLRSMLTDSEFKYRLSPEDAKLADSMKEGWSKIGHVSDMDRQAKELALLVLHQHHEPALAKLSEFEATANKFFGGAK